jgi:uncharacterized protein YuzE
MRLSIRITYDPKVKAMYIYLNDDKVARTEMVNETTVIDYDADGNIIGIELLYIEEPQLISYELLLSKRVLEAK